MAEGRVYSGTGRGRGFAGRCLAASGLMAAMACEPTLGQMACSYEVVVVLQGPDGPISASPTTPTGISPNGQHVVGSYRYDAVGPYKPWYWSQATGFVTLPMPPEFSDASPSDINNNRVLVGTGWQNGLQRGFVYDMNTQQFTIIPTLGGHWSGASAINESNVVCGTTTMVHNGNPITPIAYTWDGTTFVPLPLVDGHGVYGVAIADDGGMIVSPLAPSFGPFAGIWNGESVQNLGPIPGGESSSGAAILPGGRIVGAGAVKGSNFTWPLPFRYTTGEIVLLPVLGGEFDLGNANAINAAGVIVGSCRTRVINPTRRACVWQEDVVRDLNSLVMLPEGIYMLRSCTGIASDGRIVVSGVNDDGAIIAVVVSPVLASPGDTNCDAVVNVLDLLAVINGWGQTDSVGDLNSDDHVDVIDLLIVINHWR